MSNNKNTLELVSTYQEYKLPISVKGVVIQEGKVALVKNDRDEWELPGGRLEKGEKPEICVIREIKEEMGVIASIGRLLDTWVYEIYDNVTVFIVTYGCQVERFSELKISEEHQDIGMFTIREMEQLKMPEGYKASIRTWYKNNES